MNDPNEVLFLSVPQLRIYARNRGVNIRPKATRAEISRALGIDCGARMRPRPKQKPVKKPKKKPVQKKPVRKKAVRKKKVEKSPKSKDTSPQSTEVVCESPKIIGHYELKELECVICFFEEECVHFPCGHGVCVDMLKGQLESSVRENIMIVCPHADCNRRIEVPHIKHYFPNEEDKKVIQEAELLELRKALEALTIPCPQPDCPNQIVVENDQVREIFCDVCFQSFCPQCRDLWHFNVSCDTFQKIKLGKDNITVDAKEQFLQDEMWKEKNCRLCPHCGNLINKFEGCDHVRCGGDPYTLNGKITYKSNTQKGCGKNFLWTKAKPYKSKAKDMDAQKEKYSEETRKQMEEEEKEIEKEKERFRKMKIAQLRPLSREANQDIDGLGRLLIYINEYNRLKNVYVKLNANRRRGTKKEDYVNHIATHQFLKKKYGFERDYRAMQIPNCVICTQKVAMKRCVNCDDLPVCGDCFKEERVRRHNEGKHVFCSILQ